MNSEDIFVEHKKLQKWINSELDKARDAISPPMPYELVKPAGETRPRLLVTSKHGYTRLMDYAAGRMLHTGGPDNSALVKLKTITRSPEVELWVDGAGNWLVSRLRDLAREIEVWDRNTAILLFNFNATLSAQFLTDKDGETRYKNSRLDMVAEFYTYTWVKE